MCKKFDISSFSYSWGMFRTLKFKVDHVTWPRKFRDSLSSLCWDMLWSIGIINLKCLRLPAMKIWKSTQDIKIIVLSHRTGDSGVIHRVHLLLDGKHIVDLLFVIIELFHWLSLALTAEALLREICWQLKIGFFSRGGSLWEQILGRRGRRSQSRPPCPWKFPHKETLQQTSFDRSWILLAKQQNYVLCHPLGT